MTAVVSYVKCKLTGKLPVFPDSIIAKVRGRVSSSIVLCAHMISMHKTKLYRGGIMHYYCGIVNLQLRVTDLKPFKMFEESCVLGLARTLFSLHIVHWICGNIPTNLDVLTTFSVNISTIFWCAGPTKNQVLYTRWIHHFLCETTTCFYSICTMSSLSGSFAPICDKLACKRTAMGRIIIIRMMKS